MSLKGARWISRILVVVAAICTIKGYGNAVAYQSSTKKPEDLVKHLGYSNVDVILNDNADCGAVFNLSPSSFIEKYDKAIKECVSKNSELSPYSGSLKSKWDDGGTGPDEENWNEYAIKDCDNIMLTFETLNDKVFEFTATPSGSQAANGTLLEMYYKCAIMAITGYSYKTASEICKTINAECSFSGYHELSFNPYDVILSKDGVSYRTDNYHFNIIATADY